MLVGDINITDNSGSSIIFGFKKNSAVANALVVRFSVVPREPVLSSNLFIIKIVFTVVRPGWLVSVLNSGPVKLESPSFRAALVKGLVCR